MEIDIPNVKEEPVQTEPKKKRSKVTLTATIEKNYAEFSQLFAEFSSKIDRLCDRTIELEERTDVIFKHLQEICKPDRVCKILEIQTPEV